MEKKMKYELIEERNLFSTFGITDGLSESELEQIGGGISFGCTCLGKIDCTCYSKISCTCNVQTSNGGGHY